MLAGERWVHLVQPEVITGTVLSTWFAAGCCDLSQFIPERNIVGSGEPLGRDRLH